LTTFTEDIGKDTALCFLVLNAAQSTVCPKKCTNFERQKVDKKANLHEKWNVHTLFYSFFETFPPNVIKIYPYNFELYHFKVDAFFEIQCIQHSTSQPVW